MPKHVAIRDNSSFRDFLAASDCHDASISQAEALSSDQPRYSLILILLGT